MAQDFGHDRRNLRVGQETSTHTLIQKSFYLAPVIELDFFQLFLRSVALQFRVGAQPLQLFSSLPLKFQEHRLGQRVSEAESDEVGGTFVLYVR